MEIELLVIIKKTLLKIYSKTDCNLLLLEFRLNVMGKLVRTDLPLVHGAVT